MHRTEIDELLAYFRSEVERRHGLGGYSTDAQTMEQICRAIAGILSSMDAAKERSPRKTPR